MKTMNTMMPASLADKSLIIFDWDGTLQNTIGLIVDAMQSAAKTQGLSISEQAVKGIIGLEIMIAIQQLFPQADEATCLKVLQSYGDYYIDNAEHCKLYDGVESMIKALSKQGRKLAVATGKKRVGLQRSFNHTNIQAYFTASRCADESGSKPNPAMLKEILTQTNTPLKSAVFIGDSIYDIQMANEIGMDSIAVTYGCEKPQVLASQNPTYVVNTVAELANFLG
ncbi:HAD-IIIA family hydrolase [Psychrobacter sp. HD31]|uniref:HAD family hydrolase n=1 Tax=Psychrobacter sp. HD31 TaxID=3112003 RepID=UPI003DA51023